MVNIDDRAIAERVNAFENATIGHDEWKHAEHMIVAIFYLEKFGYEAACEKMRAGILNLLRTGFRVDLSKAMPYHETITIFWMNALEEYRRRCSALSLTEKVREILEVYDKDFPLRFYSRKLLFSDTARREYVAPDVKQLHEAPPVTRGK